MNSPLPWFGLTPPASAQHAWGARAIIEEWSERKPMLMKRGPRKGFPRYTRNDYGRLVLAEEMVFHARLDLLPDRQSVRGNIRDSGLGTWIDTVVLPDIRMRLSSDAAFAKTSDTITEWCTDMFHAQASPRASYGYLYIVAWKGNNEFDDRRS